MTRRDEEITLDWLLDRVVISPDSGCWIWVGADSGSNGRGHSYPKMSVGGYTVYVHRYSYNKFVRRLRRGQQVDHCCARWGNWDRKLVRRCIRLDHLEAVSHLTNQRRKFK